MHLLAFIRQMPSSSDQSVKDALKDMPEVLSLFEIISLSHSKENFLKQVRKQQADIRAKNKTKGSNRQGLGTALGKAQYAITIKTGVQQQGLFVRMTGGFENEHYRQLNQIWDKAVEGGNFELNRVSEILKFVRTANIVTESVSFSKDPKPAFSTRQKTQTTALADFSAQLDAVGKTPIGMSLQKSAEALYVKAFLVKDERVPNPPQPQWPTFGTVCFNQLHQAFQWTPPGRWVPIVMLRSPGSDTGSTVSTLSDASTNSYLVQPSQPAIDFDNDAVPANSVPSQHYVQQQPQHSHGGGGEMQMQSRQLVISPQLSQLSPQQQFQMQQQQQFQQQQFQMQQQQQQHPTTIVPVQPQQQPQMQQPPEPQVTMAGTNDGSVP